MIPVLDVLRRRTTKGQDGDHDRRSAAFLGDARAGRLLPVQALHSMGETMFAVSLAGSLFFNVSVDAARPRILMYLAITMAPFAILGPLIGPFIDRVGGGHRTMLMIALGGRALTVAVLATQLRSLLFYPLAFVVIVLAKVFAVSRNAVVPVLVADRDHLVVVNSRLARTASIAGALAAPLGLLLLELGGAAWVLRGGAILYSSGAVLAWRIPGIRPASTSESTRVVESTEMGAPNMRAATVVMAGMRAAIGFSLFHIGFTLKRAGEPAWVFGIMAAASAAGTFLGTFVAPRLRKRYGERSILTITLVPPIVLGVVTALRFHAVTVALFAFALGLSASVARRAFDGVVQAEAPHAKRGQAFAGLETRLELAWVLGALAAVSTRSAGWIGMAAVVVGYGVLLGDRVWRRRNAAKVEEVSAPGTLALRLLETAEALAARGDRQQAVVVAVAAVDAAEVTGAPVPAHTDLRSRADAVATGGADPETADEVLRAARELVNDAVEDLDGSPAPHRVRRHRRSRPADVTP